jgi:ectoine hydroxylase-related dioxygenase (phytanoyl-CoA dioxygenase family)
MKNKEKILKFYKKNGYYIFKNYYKKSIIEEIKRYIFYISSELYRAKTHKKIIKYNSKKFDFYVLKSKKEKFKDITSSIYDTCKKLPIFYEIMSSKKTLNICKNLMSSDKLGILNTGYGFRIDYPQDIYWKARLHQDYSGQLGSTNAAVIYTAFDSITKKRGAPILYAGSHHHGMLDTDLRLEDVKQKKTYDPYHVRIKPKELNMFKKVDLVLYERDMAIFDFKLLHESGHNSSNKIRWSAIHRVFDMKHESAIKNLFRGGMNEGNFFKKNKKVNLIKIKSAK